MAELQLPPRKKTKSKHYGLYASSGSYGIPHNLRMEFELQLMAFSPEDAVSQLLEREFEINVVDLSEEDDATTVRVGLTLLKEKAQNEV